jgi:hypothetical protein
VNELTSLLMNQLQELNKTHAAIRTKLDEQISAARAEALKRPAHTEDATARYLRHKDAVEYFNSVDPPFVSPPSE